MSSEIVTSPAFLEPLIFDSKVDLLGRGTTGEVFKARISTTYGVGENRKVEISGAVVALKRFFHRSDRDDFENEQRILHALSVQPHKHIAELLCSWSADEASYMVFPLAHGDVKTLLHTLYPDKPTATTYEWLLSQFHGLCHALSYIHDHKLHSTYHPLRRIGFHHDIKPDNILVFSTGAHSTWKFCDFGSGSIKYTSPDSDAEIYNRKASTGDPVYSAPEFVVEEKVGRAKDIWSLGCVFLEVALWTIGESVPEFRKSRATCAKNTPNGSPTFWSVRDNNLPYLNDEVRHSFRRLDPTLDATSLMLLMTALQKMLVVDPAERITAAELCCELLPCAEAV